MHGSFNRMIICIYSLYNLCNVLKIIIIDYTKGVSIQYVGIISINRNHCLKLPNI